MAPSNLSLFPVITTSMPRSVSLRRTRADDIAANAAGEISLQGVAFQVVTDPSTSSKIQPTSQSIQHSLFCQSPTTELPEISPDIQPTFTSSLGHEGPPSRKGISATAWRPSTPRNISTLAQSNMSSTTTTSIVRKSDNVSPLLDQTRLPSAFPTPVSELSFSSPMPAVASASPKSYDAPIRSIFPVYDPTKPLDRQDYYPAAAHCTPPRAAFTSNSVSDQGSLTEVREPNGCDPAVGFINGFEHIPTAVHADMGALWLASRGKTSVAGRKAQFGLHQPSGNGKLLAIGTSQQDLIYCLEKDSSSSSTQDVAAPKQYAVRRLYPTAPRLTTAATFALPDRTYRRELRSRVSQEKTIIFPHTAAINAMEAVTSSQKACHSSEAAQIARDAIAEAQRRYACDLVKKTRERDSLGNVTAQYDLVHPSLGICPVTVTKSQSSRSINGPRAKISLHHPSATPAAVAADSLSLAFLDFAHDACVLDLPGLLALDTDYFVDTIVCALLAVAVIENDNLLAETITFDAPPKTPFATSRRVEREKGLERSSRGRLKRSKKRNHERKTKEVVRRSESPDKELGGVGRGALAVMELTFKVSSWVIIAGVKVGAGVIGYGVDKIQSRLR